MRKVVLSILLTFVSMSVFAQDNNLFSCVSDDKLTINHDCVAKTIDNNVQLREFNDNFNMELSDIGGRVMSTVIFYPELMQTRVIAVPESASTSRVAAVRTTSSTKLSDF